MHGRMKKRPGPLAPPESECIFLRKICLRSFFQMLEEIFRKSVGQFSFLVQGTFLQATKAENHCSFILLHNLMGGHWSRWWWSIYNADPHGPCLFVGHEKWSLFSNCPHSAPAAVCLLLQLLWPLQPLFNTHTTTDIKIKRDIFIMYVLQHFSR